MKNKFGKYFYWFAAIFPFILSAIFYSKLPEQVAIHWDSAGNPDNYASRPFAAFAVPLILLAVVVFVNFSISADPRKQNIDRSPQMKFVIRWFIVLIVNVAQLVTIFQNINQEVNVTGISTALIGISIAAIGNYLPKCKYNFTVGIKLPWTLASEENWRKTHRIAGFVWIIGGILLTVNAFLSLPGFSIGIIMVLVFIPTVYSYCIYVKNKGQKDHDE